MKKTTLLNAGSKWTLKFVLAKEATPIIRDGVNHLLSFGTNDSFPRYMIESDLSSEGSLLLGSYFAGWQIRGLTGLSSREHSSASSGTLSRTS